MVEIDRNGKKFIQIEDTGLKDQKILERNDLQEYIVNSWETFTKEIGLPDIYFIGKEVNPHNSVKDRIDILAFDPKDSNIVIIELKRDKEKTQLIQALSYAGMINTWTSEDIISVIQDSEETKEYFEGGGIEFGIKIVLLAENYDPEIILTADWLKSKYNLNISAFIIKLHKFDKKIILDIEQKYPLKELSDAYQARIRQKNTKQIKAGTRTWDDIKKKLKYDFGGKVIDYLCSKYYQGDPSRARFVTTKSKDDINNLCISFRFKYINIYADVANKEEGKEKIKKVFGETFEINEWQGGLSFNIRTEEEYTKFKEWFNI
jgi:hypothetical protein